MGARELLRRVARGALAAALALLLMPVAAFASGETATSGMASDEISSDVTSSSTVVTEDDETAGQSGNSDESGEGGEAGDGAADTTESGDSETEVTAKPYSILTPLDDAGNTVNTHQLPDSSFLYDTSLTDLAGATSYYDGQTVQITGEVIGDILKAGTEGTHVWVTLASTSETSDATIVIYVPVGSVSIIDTLGAYGKTGTILQVRGTFHLACPDHEGISDIHVENVNVVSPGTTTPDEFRFGDFTFGIVGLLLAGAMAFVFHLLRQRLR